MATGNPTQVGTNTSQAGGQTSIAAAGCVIPANSLVVVALINSNGGTAPGDASAVSDGTHSYAKDVSNGGQSNVGNVQFWSFYDATGGTRTITCTIPSSNMTFLYVYVISGAATSSYLDVTGTANNSSGTDFAVATSTPSSGLVAQVDSVGIAMGGSGTNNTAPSTWPGTGLTSLVNVNNATRSLRINVEYLNQLTAGAVFTGTGTLGASNNRGRVAAVYKGASGGATAYTMTLTGSITPTGAIGKTATKTLAGSLTPAGAVVKAAAKSVAGSVTAAGVAVKAATKTLAGTITSVGTTKKGATKTVAGSSTPSGAPTKAATKAATGSVTPSGTVGRAAAKTVRGTVTPTGTATKTGTKTLAGSVTPAGLISKAGAKRLLAAITPAGAVSFASAVITVITRFFDPPSPGGGADPSSPSSGAFDPPGPGQERT